MYYIVSIPAEQVMITLWQSTLQSSTGEGRLPEQEAAATQDTTAEVSIQIDIVDIETWRLTLRDIFSLQGTSALTQKLRRRVTFVSFRGTIKPLVPGDLV